MASKKTLKAVAHDIAHHAQSGLSWLSPHLGKACRAAGVSAATVELVSSDPYPTGLPHMKSLELAMRALSSKALDILAEHGHQRAAATSINLTFSFPADPRDDSLYAVRSSVTAYEETYIATLPLIGTRYVDPKLRRPRKA